MATSKAQRLNAAAAIAAAGLFFGCPNEGLPQLRRHSIVDVQKSPDELFEPICKDVMSPASVKDIIRSLGAEESFSYEIKVPKNGWTIGICACKHTSGPVYYFNPKTAEMESINYIVKVDGKGPGMDYSAIPLENYYAVTENWTTVRYGHGKESDRKSSLPSQKFFSTIYSAIMKKVDLRRDSGSLILLSENRMVDLNLSDWIVYGTLKVSYYSDAGTLIFGSADNSNRINVERKPDLVMNYAVMPNKGLVVIVPTDIQRNR